MKKEDCERINRERCDVIDEWRREQRRKEKGYWDKGHQEYLENKGETE